MKKVIIRQDTVAEWLRQNTYTKERLDIGDESIIDRLLTGYSYGRKLFKYSENIKPDDYFEFHFEIYAGKISVKCLNIIKYRVKYYDSVCYELLLISNQIKQIK